jgi:transcriptional regulator with XRE-family HTH domain
MVLFRRELGDVLRGERMRRGMTLRELSSEARISLGYISEIERGQKEASSELLASLCDALEVSLTSRSTLESGRGHRPGSSAERRRLRRLIRSRAGAFARQSETLEVALAERHGSHRGVHDVLAILDMAQSEDMPELVQHDSQLVRVVAAGEVVA